MHSSLYVGQVSHRRFTPREHAFSYRMFMLYLDLDELPDLFQRFRFWSVNRPNIASFRRSDHLGDKQRPLKQCVYDLIEQHTGQRPCGPVRLLTHLSYFGFRFNPVSFYYCFDAQGETLEYLVAEVNNTPWGEQFCYVMSADDNLGSARIHRYQAEKSFHVSPFMSMDMNYDWRFSVPADTLSVYMQNRQGGEKIFDATLMLEQRPVNSKQLAAVLIRFPLMTLKVVAAIYFEALRLWLKKVPFIDHPGTSKEAPKSVKTS
ncbi:MAG: DUF1365 domain-containing protein [Thiolinea sp.]